MWEKYWNLFKQINLIDLFFCILNKDYFRVKKKKKTKVIWVKKHSKKKN
jgi:hypothetical protein